MQQEAGEDAVAARFPSHPSVVLRLQPDLLVPRHGDGQAAGRHLSLRAAQIAERRQQRSVQLQHDTQTILYRGVEHEVVRPWDPTPEVSRVGVVVPVDVGDDHGEPDDAGSLRVFVGSPGHAEGRPLLDTDRPMFSGLSRRALPPGGPWFPRFPTLPSFTREPLQARFARLALLGPVAASPLGSWISSLSLHSITTVSARKPRQTWHPVHPCCRAGLYGDQRGYGQ